MFWILLHTMYAVSEDADRDFYSLNTQGRQGTMDLRSFAEEVKRRYQCVEHIGGTTEEEVAVVFYLGLNHESTIKVAKETMGKDRTLSIDDLLLVLEEHERANHIVDLVQSKSARYNKDSAKASSSKSSANHRSSAGSSSSSRKSQVEQFRGHRETYLHLLERTNPAEFALIEAAINLAEKHPGHPKAVCLNCDKGKVHLVAECPAIAAAAAALVDPAKASSSGSSHGGKPPAYGAAAGGLFRGVPKPDQSGQAKGGRSYGYQPSNNTQQPPQPSQFKTTRCQVCGFREGHPSGVCYYNQPRLAPPHWMGPTPWTSPDLVQLYLEHCQLQRVVPKLGKCWPAVEQLKAQGRLSGPILQILPQPQAELYAPSPSAASCYHNPPVMNAAATQAQPGSWTMTRDPVVPSGIVNPWLQQHSFQQSAPFAGPAVPQYPQPGTPWMHTRPGTGQSAIQTFNAAGAYMQEPHLQPPGTAQPPPNQVPPSHRGYHFSMSAVADIDEVLQHARTFTSLDSVLHYALPKERPLLCTAAAATRASTRQNAGDSGVQHAPKPKSFVPVPPQLPQDGNSNRLPKPPLAVSELSTVSEQSSGHDFNTQQSGTGLDRQPLQASHPVTLAWSSINSKLHDQQQSQGDLQAELQRLQSLTDPTAMLSVSPQVQSTAVAVKSCGAAVVSCSEVKAVMPLELLFTPPSMDYVNRQRKHQGLDRLCCNSKSTGITLVLPDDREILLNGVFSTCILFPI